MTIESGFSGVSEYLIEIQVWTQVPQAGTTITFSVTPLIIPTPAPDDTA